MQQVLQNIRDGKLSLAEVPSPLAQKGQVLIANQRSLISAGTEKMIMDLAQKSLLGKARERPDHVKRVLQKVKNEGLVPTVQAVLTKLDEPMSMGYASAGIVLACGEGVENIKPGDRVASNGPHAGVVSIPHNLVARIPDNVSFDHASFTVLGSIALQGVRLAKSQLGETAFVIGLGLVGQLTVGLLKAAGCRVFGTDPDPSKCELALEMGAECARPNLNASAIESLTDGHGADAVLITASTSSNGPIELAAAAVRQKGRVVLVGVVGLELDRRPFFFKEAEFVVSCSYGPGRYDPSYETLGHDYPFAHVRWTEQRNFQAVLNLIASNSLDLDPLISHHYPIEKATEAYSMISEGKTSFLGIILDYPSPTADTSATTIELKSTPNTGKIGVGVLGAGNFARSVLIPAIRSQETFRQVSICSAGGTSAAHTGEKYGFEKACTNEADLLVDSNIDALFAITQHNLHARQVETAIRNGKHIFVEKPLCMTTEELTAIEEAIEGRENVTPGKAPIVMVGFNRRFSPTAKQAREFFADTQVPLTVSFRFNAGEIPADHWTQDPELGGGRIIGEACHAIDTATYLVGSPPVRVYAESIGGSSAPQVTDDQCFITLRHANGSISSIAYLAGGDKAFPKERVEIIGAGRVAVIDDFRSLTTVRGGKTSKTKSKQDKGHKAEVEAFANALRDGTDAPISWTDLRAVTLASILAVRSLREGTPFEL